MEHNTVQIYSGTYNEIPYEIRHWYFSDGTPQWNYYLFLIEEQLPDLFDKIWIDGNRMKLGGKETNHIFYDYDDTPISNLDWHGGCTYYNKESGWDGARRVIKVGCDYAHYFDTYQSYSLENIETDLIDCIESLHHLTKVLFRCMYCGSYVETVNEKHRCIDCKDK